MITKHNNIYNIFDNDAKLINIKYLYYINKSSKTDLLHSYIVCDLLQKSTANLNAKEFLKAKLNNYNQSFSIEVVDKNDKILFIYSSTFINPKYVNDLEIKNCVELFKDFIINTTIDYSYLTSTIEMQKLIFKDTKQDYRMLSKQLNEDNLFKNSEYYLTLDEQIQLLENVNEEVIHTFISKMKPHGIHLIYSGPDNIVDLDEFNITQSKIKLNQYINDSLDNNIIKLDIEQSVININYKLKNVDDYTSKVLFNQMFGSGSSSILFKQIRENKNLCYYIYSQIIEKDILVVTIGTSIDQADLAIQEINNIVSNLQDYLNEELFKIISNKYISKLESYRSNKNYFQSLVLGNILYGRDFDLDLIIQKVQNIKFDSILIVSEDIKKINYTKVG